MVAGGRGRGENQHEPRRRAGGSLRRSVTGCMLASGVVASSLVAAAETGPPAPYAATRLRPLFAPGRHPPPADAAGDGELTLPPPPAVPPPAFVLTGVIVGDGTGTALLQRPSQAAAIRVSRGGTIDGWTVAEIRPRAVVLSRDGRSITVEMTSGPR